MSIRSQPTGFTLVELLVGTAIGAVVLTGIAAVFVSQAWRYQAHANRRAVQSSVRQALGFVERHVRNAGYGVDPDRALLAYDSYDAASNAHGEGFPDALTVHSRTRTSAASPPRWARTSSSSTWRCSGPCSRAKSCSCSAPAPSATPT